MAAIFAQNPRHKLFVDVSRFVLVDAKTGIQRVVRAYLQELLRSPPPGFDVELVYAADENLGYRHAHNFLAKNRLSKDADGKPREDSMIRTRPGDIFFGLDLAPEEVVAREETLRRMRHGRVKVVFVVYDLLPITMPEFFSPAVGEFHSRWLRVVAKGDALHCISASVADDVRHWLDANLTRGQRRPKVTWAHLGADIENSIPSRGYPQGARSVLQALGGSPVFLTVSTIEPRKGHGQTLQAFELLWSQGVDAKLVFVGAEGWMVEELVGKLRGHEQLGKKLFWLEGISDEYLSDVYKAADCLIISSKGEGFGLPVIEAAQHGLPVIARDIPVFREIAGEHAFYFEGHSGEALAERLLVWLDRRRSGERLPEIANLKWLTWDESTRQVVKILLEL